MLPHCVRPIFACLLTICVGCVVSGCDKRTDAGSPGNTAGSSSAASPIGSGSAPIAGVVPAEDAAGSGVPGPGSGTTAVGGMAAQQDAGGNRSSNGRMPAPTGGDGAASASQPSASAAR